MQWQVYTFSAGFWTPGTTCMWLHLYYCSPLYGDARKGRSIIKHFSTKSLLSCKEYVEIGSYNLVHFLCTTLDVQYKQFQQTFFSTSIPFLSFSWNGPLDISRRGDTTEALLTILLYSAVLLYPGETLGPRRNCHCKWATIIEAQFLLLTQLYQLLRRIGFAYNRYLGPSKHAEWKRESNEKPAPYSWSS